MTVISTVDHIKTMTFIFTLYSRNDSWKVLDENVRFFNALLKRKFYMTLEANARGSEAVASATTCASLF